MIQLQNQFKSSRKTSHSYLKNQESCSKKRKKIIQYCSMPATENRTLFKNEKLKANKLSGILENITMAINWQKFCTYQINSINDQTN